MKGLFVFFVTIDKQGRVVSDSVILVSATHPFFVEPSKKALSEWRYVPVRLNGEPIVFERHEIIINFVLPKSDSKKL